MKRPIKRTRDGFYSWSGAKRRCFDSRFEGFGAYGARGITMCRRWAESFDDFMADMGPKPGPEYSLDRIDVNGNYEPGNCRWATWDEQYNNTRRIQRLTLNGVVRTTREWANSLGLPSLAIVKRLRRGWSMEAALTTPALSNSGAHVARGDDHPMSVRSRLHMPRRSVRESIHLIRRSA